MEYEVVIRPLNLKLNRSKQRKRRRNETQHTNQRTFFRKTFLFSVISVSSCSITLEVSAKLFSPPACDEHPVPAQILRPDCFCRRRRACRAVALRGGNEALTF